MLPDHHFNTYENIELPLPVQQRQSHSNCSGLTCHLHGRRLFTGLLSTGLVTPWASTFAQEQSEEGVQQNVGKGSVFSKLVSAEQLEETAALQYQKMAQEAAKKNALASNSHPQMIRLRYIMDRMIPYTATWNPRAKQWKWEVRLFGSQQINAFCMPGGKIAFYYGILQQLQLNDDEVAMIMGHEIAHALREHARERMGKGTATRVGTNILSSLLGLGQLGDIALGMGAQLLSLKFSRDDETEADLVGAELAARAGYNPSAGMSLWRKMMSANKNAPPQFLSTHPAGDTRIQDIERILPKVSPIYARAEKPSQPFSPPAASQTPPNTARDENPS
jgi:Zn-dependent protease with chaperone function